MPSKATNKTHVEMGMVFDTIQTASSLSQWQRRLGVVSMAKMFRVASVAKRFGVVSVAKRFGGYLSGKCLGVIRYVHALTYRSTCILQ